MLGRRESFVGTKRIWLARSVLSRVNNISQKHYFIEKVAGPELAVMLKRIQYGNKQGLTYYRDCLNEFQLI